MKKRKRSKRELRERDGIQEETGEREEPHERKVNGKQNGTRKELRGIIHLYFVSGSISSFTSNCLRCCERVRKESSPCRETKPYSRKQVH